MGTVMVGIFVSGRSEDEGFTLIELLIYLSLATVILAIVGGFMISSLKIERDVSSVAEATNAAQLVSTSVQAAVRNGSGARVETAQNGDQMLVALTAPIGGSGATVCQAWFYSATNRSVYTKTSLSPAAVIAWPTSSPAGSWTLLGSGIKPSESAKYVFEPAVDPPAVDPPAVGRAVGPNSDSVSMSFEVTAGVRAPVRIETTAYTRIDATVGAPCFP